MIDYFSLILGHALLTIVLFKVMMQDDAEQPPRSGAKGDHRSENAKPRSSRAAGRTRR